MRLARSPVAPKRTNTAGRFAGSGCCVVVATRTSYVAALTRPGPALTAKCVRARSEFHIRTTTTTGTTTTAGMITTNDRALPQPRRAGRARPGQGNGQTGRRRAGAGPDDVRELAIAEGEAMLRLAGVDGDPAKALVDGLAQDKFGEMIRAQGGDLSQPLAQGRTFGAVTAWRDGVVRRLDARAAGMASWRLGAGRSRPGETVSAAAGVICYAKPFDAAPGSEIGCSGESGRGRVEVVENPAGGVGLPWFAGRLGGVELVQVHQQVDQLAADGRGLEQRRQLGQVDEPPPIPARPVVVGSVDDAENTMMGLAGLTQKLTDLFRGSGHLVPPATALVLAAALDRGYRPHRVVIPGSSASLSITLPG